jgi:hypothetical protein
MILELETRAGDREPADPGKGKELAGADQRRAEEPRGSRVQDCHRVADNFS